MTPVKRKTAVSVLANLPTFLRKEAGVEGYLVTKD